MWVLKLIFIQIFLLYSTISFGQLNKKFNILCQSIYIRSPASLVLSESEKKLVCSDHSVAPYDKIPNNQRRYLLEKFLESRGYYDYQIEEKSQNLYIDSGAVAITRSIIIRNDPFGIDPSRFWKAYGHPLTSTSLDRIEEWVRDQLSKHGYPCVKIRTLAYPERGDIEINIEDAKQKKFGRVTMDPISGLIGGIESRYQAFKSGDIFDSRLLAVSNQRMLASELVLNATYAINCSTDENIQIDFSHLAGKPRLVSISTGFDTEEIFNFEASWQHARLGELGSMMLLSAKSSYRTQNLRFLYDWYYAPFPIKHSIKTFLTVKRDFEKDYENIQFQTQVGPTFSFDYAAALIEFWLGLKYEYNEVLRGEGLGQSHSLPLVFNLDLQDHDYELNQSDPSSGYRLNLTIENSSKDLASDFSEFRVRMDALFLKNLFKLDPAVWVLGLRASLETINLGSDAELDKYPQSKRLYLGGSDSIRGFARKSIPQGGALTKLYLGTELRLLQLFPFGLQPVIFLDYARQGRKAAFLKPTNFWSPGVGMHWKTFIGLIRGTVSYGLISGQDKDNYANKEGLQVYLSYGENF